MSCYVRAVFGKEEEKEKLRVRVRVTVANQDALNIQVTLACQITCACMHYCPLSDASYPCNASYFLV